MLLVVVLIPILGRYGTIRIVRRGLVKAIGAVGVESRHVCSSVGRYGEGKILRWYIWISIGSGGGYGGCLDSGLSAGVCAR